MVIRLKEYELYCRENEIAKNTIKNYMNTLNQLNKYLMKKNVESITKENMIDFKDYLRIYEYRPGSKYNLNTINQKITAINIYFNWYEATYRAGGTSELNLKPIRTQDKSHRESINEDDFKRLLRYADGEIKLFILTIANTGLRVSEVCNLRRSDLYQSIIQIENKGKIRIIDIPLFLKNQLREFTKEHEDNERIFNKTQGYYRKELKAVAGKARVKKSKVYPHSIRHFFAKKFISDGGDSTTLQQMLGHSNIATTTVYTKLDREELARQFRETRNR